jgi:hypothetical protein
MSANRTHSSEEEHMGKSIIGKSGRMYEWNYYYGYIWLKADTENGLRTVGKISWDEHLQAFHNMPQQEFASLVDDSGAIDILRNMKAKKNAEEQDTHDAPHENKIPKEDNSGTHDINEDMSLMDIPWKDYAASQPGDSLADADMGSWQKNLGIQGEMNTAKVLQNVSGAKVFHSVQRSSRSDIDHIVICSRGIFVINSKNYTKPLLIDGLKVKWQRSDGRLEDTIDWQSNAINVVSEIQGKLAKPEYGYGQLAGRIPVYTAFAIWGEQARIIGSDPVVPFRDGAIIDQWIQSHETALTEALVDALHQDMRRGTFWNLL